MNLFTYGVLQHPKILRPLCGESFAMQAAQLNGYRKVFFDYEPFAPCAIIKPDTGAVVHGQMLVGVRDYHLPLFDSFECVDQGWYSRAKHAVQTDDGVMHEAYVYVAGSAAPPFFGDDWDEAFFLSSGRLEYLEAMLKGEATPQTQSRHDSI